jgi:hypothetical protein
MDLERKRQTNKKAAWAVLGGILTYLFLVLLSLFVVSPKVQHMAVDASVNVALGPLTLFQIQKTAVTSGGFVLEYSLRPGLMYLLFIFFVVGASYILFKKYKTAVHY